MSDIATPPATGVWYDDAVTLANVLHTLRLQGGDIDAERLGRDIARAGIIIDGYVDAETVIEGPPPAADYQGALEWLALVLYRDGVPVSAGLYAAPVTETYIRAGLDAQIAHRRARWAVA